MGRTIPAWRQVVNSEMDRMKKFADFLRPEDKVVFEDMMNQCKIYASYASTMASPVKEVPLMMSILFAQHKMLWKHEKQLRGPEKPTPGPQKSLDEPSPK
jgi:hypothetical protein